MHFNPIFNLCISSVKYVFELKNQIFPFPLIGLFFLENEGGVSKGHLGTNNPALWEDWASGVAGVVSNCSWVDEQLSPEEEYRILIISSDWRHRHSGRGLSNQSPGICHGPGTKTPLISQMGHSQFLMLFIMFLRIGRMGSRKVSGDGISDNLTSARGRRHY